MSAIPTGKPWHYYLAHLFILIGVAILGAIVFSFLGMMLARLIYPEIDAQAFMENLSTGWVYPMADFLVIGLASLGSFMAPAVIYPLILRQRFATFFPLGLPKPLLLVALAVVLAFLAMSPTALIAELNSQIDVSRWGRFGQWLQDNERSSLELFGTALSQPGAAGLIAAFLVIAVIPAVGEELAFRGVLQRLFQTWTGRHLGIVITAVCFSAVHGEFSGFLPRIFLGLFLGYVFFWTNNLWFTILIHFVNNAFIVIAVRLYGDGHLDVNEVGTPDLLMAIGGTLVFSGFLYFFFKLSRQKTRSDGEELGETLHD
jgi:membrane protease YdiL (CAAX protease family)